MLRLILGVVSLAVLAAGGVLGYRWLTPGPPPPDLAPLERTLADRAVAEVATALVFPAGVDTVTAPLLEGPKGPEVGALLRARLVERGRHIVEVASLKQEHPSFSRFFEMIAGQGVARWADARWKEAGVHAFVRGRATYADEAGATVCTLEAWLEDSGSGTRLGAPALSRQAIRRSVFDLDYYRLTVAGIGAGWRVLAWVGLLLALPLVTWPLNTRLLSRERNATNLLVWVGYTGVDVGAALALTGFATPGFFGTIALLLALGLSLFYNYGVLSEIEDLRR